MGEKFGLYRMPQSLWSTRCRVHRIPGSSQPKTCANCLTLQLWSKEEKLLELLLRAHVPLSCFGLVAQNTHFADSPMPLLCCDQSQVVKMSMTLNGKEVAFDVSKVTKLLVHYQKLKTIIVVDLRSRMQSLITSSLIRSHQKKLCYKVRC